MSGTDSFDYDDPVYKADVAYAVGSEAAANMQTNIADNEANRRTYASEIVEEITAIPEDSCVSDSESTVANPPTPPPPPPTQEEEALDIYLNAVAEHTRIHEQKAIEIEQRFNDGTWGNPS